MKFKLDAEHIQSMPIQLFLVASSFIFLMLCLYRPITQFHPVDSKPFVKEITPALLTQWKTTDPIHVKTGMSITDFLKFDAIKNEYIVNAIIWFTFNPKQVPLKDIEAFSFTKGDIIKKSEPILIEAGNLTTVQYHIRIQFGTIPNYKRFPLDDHYMYLNVTNTAVNPKQVIFDLTPEDFTLSPNLYVPGWSIVQHKGLTGYSATQISPTQEVILPKMSYSIGLSKQDYRQLLLILLPLLLIFYFGIFAFSIKDITLAITLVLASVAGLIAYSFVIQTLSPTVGYLMLSDYIFLLFLAIIFIIFFVTALNATPEHILSSKTIERIKGGSIIAIYISLTGLWFYLTNIKDIV